MKQETPNADEAEQTRQSDEALGIEGQAVVAMSEQAEISQRNKYRLQSRPQQKGAHDNGQK